MNGRLLVAFLATSTLLAGAASADPGSGGSLAATIQSPPATITAVQPAMAEVFRPAPVPGDDARHGGREVAEAGPNLHPDLLSLQNRSSGALSNSDIAYDRNQRVRPAGGMSLDIPMQ